MPGGSLSDFLEKKGLVWQEPLLRLACDIATGMQYLHTREYFDEEANARKTCILHRDLKSENVLVTDYSSAKISDFGTSRAKAEEDSATMTAVGTPL